MLALNGYVRVHLTPYSDNATLSAVGIGLVHVVSAMRKVAAVDTST
jgi:hypothetical protein